MSETETNAPRLQFFPIAWFSTVMGLSGFTIAWARAEHILALPFTVSPFFKIFTAALFIALSLTYLMKILRFPQAVKAEINHPVKIAFLPSFSISLLLLSIVFAGDSAIASQILWSSGTALHFLFTIYVLSSWLHQSKYEIKHLNPAWFIPIVGNILVPVVGLQHGPADISWFFFSIGLFFWPILTGIIFYRLIFHPSLPERLFPTLFIFLAPPSVACISWFNLTGQFDAFARILYFIAMFFFIFLLVQLPYFLKLKFFLSWWAYSFPVAALTIATLLLVKTGAAGYYTPLAAVLLALLSLLIVILVVQTARAMINHAICVDDSH